MCASVCGAVHMLHAPPHPGAVVECQVDRFYHGVRRFCGAQRWARLAPREAWQVSEEWRGKRSSAEQSHILLLKIPDDRPSLIPSLVFPSYANAPFPYPRSCSAPSETSPSAASLCSGAWPTSSSRSLTTTPASSTPPSSASSNSCTPGASASRWKLPPSQPPPVVTPTTPRGCQVALWMRA